MFPLISFGDCTVGISRSNVLGERRAKPVRLNQLLDAISARVEQRGFYPSNPLRSDDHHLGFTVPFDMSVLVEFFQDIPSEQSGIGVLSPIDEIFRRDGAIRIRIEKE